MKTSPIKKGTTTPPSPKVFDLFDLYAAAALQGYIQSQPPETPEEIEQVVHSALTTAKTLLKIKKTHYASLS